ncbi:RDD family protein [Pseudomaricurvus sp.]|uniref:RDD family protein n=1 Tax=Pseudomaricurvus sp. TaxID=2004510 RepID=UPI003F6C502A
MEKHTEDNTQPTTTSPHYAGFWIRVAASLIDTLLFIAIIAPLLTLIYGTAYWDSGTYLKGNWDLVLNYIFPAVAVTLFWVYKSATPGKMIFKLKIVDANTLGKASTGQMIGRYLGYYVSIIPLMLGIIWVGFDRRKQGFHDKLAKTVVIKQS